MHKAIMGQSKSAQIVDLEAKWWQKVLTVLKGLLVAVAVLAAIVVTAGAAGAIVGAIRNIFSNIW